MHRGILHALLAAALFGASTPLAKLLTGQMPSTLLAGLLYAGSGIGLGACLLWRTWHAQRAAPALQGRSHDTPQVASLRKADLGWLAAAIAAGGIAGPLLLLAGLHSMPASSAALLLNLEGVLTALIAWFVFRENFDLRIMLGMLAIVAAGVLLSWQGAGETGIGFIPALLPGALAVSAACLCWAVDNNLTRKISASDALQIAACKGLVAGSVNLLLAAGMGEAWPAASIAASAALLGFFGYGISLVLFVLALRSLGSARTGAYFSAAPFVGAGLAIVLLHETPDLRFGIAAALMALGLWLHLSERHGHRHRHDPTFHMHEHAHAAPGATPTDPHHRHGHDFPWDGSSPHTHAHQHEALAHTHAHFPDIHHRHRH